jgi:hypothetical protein
MNMIKTNGDATCHRTLRFLPAPLRVPAGYDCPPPAERFLLLVKHSGRAGEKSIMKDLVSSPTCVRCHFAGAHLQGWVASCERRCCLAVGKPGDITHLFEPRDRAVLTDAGDCLEEGYKLFPLHHFALTRREERDVQEVLRSLLDFAHLAIGEMPDVDETQELFARMSGKWGDLDVLIYVIVMPPPPPCDFLKDLHQ